MKNCFHVIEQKPSQQTVTPVRLRLLSTNEIAENLAEFHQQANKHLPSFSMCVLILTTYIGTQVVNYEHRRTINWEKVHALKNRFSEYKENVASSSFTKIPIFNSRESQNQ